MCSNFLKQMEIDALELMISEGVKVQGQIVHDGLWTCLMAFRIVTIVVTGGDKVYHHSSARVVARGVRTHLNARGPLLPSQWEKNPASPWWVSLESANLALERVYDFLPVRDRCKKGPRDGPIITTVGFVTR
jgi:hypothetical protein